MVLVRDQYHLRTPVTKLLTQRRFICPKGRESSDKGQRNRGRGRRVRGQGRGKRYLFQGDKGLPLDRGQTTWQIQKPKFIKVQGEMPCLD